jgi:copper chaperone CopZ
MKLKTRTIHILFASLLFITPLIAADPHAGHKHNDDPVLPEGAYSARVKTMACLECAPLIEKTLRNTEGMGPVHVDTKDSRVHFSVKKGATVKWSTIQTALKNAAEKMGMGADFSLSEFRISDSAHNSKTPDMALSSGYYEAKVGAIVCGGCKDLIEKTMRSVNGIGAAQVDEQKGTVKFTVLKDKNVQLSAIQASLKMAADQMGMGADYSLSNVKPLQKK